jgi:hypothetical protein
MMTIQVVHTVKGYKQEFWLSWMWYLWKPWEREFKMFWLSLFFNGPCSSYALASKLFEFHFCFNCAWSCSMQNPFCSMHIQNVKGAALCKTLSALCTFKMWRELLYAKSFLLYTLSREGEGEGEESWSMYTPRAAFRANSHFFATHFQGDINKAAPATSTFEFE